ncbi:tyrosine-type recombinase/integrase [Vibrio metschnikovii]|uniref:tyrosine-type recombinase/integrase n=1 Tax=Vibrio metschnikovii TaxID=28172 RepID=UPI001C2FE538|nr:tyrosine-type recombinase/integrase [Vibrio metschnikovii]MDA3140131.1 tyrosine-type recombinase/integrase [Vibrio metschnikovii]
MKRPLVQLTEAKQIKAKLLEFKYPITPQQLALLTQEHYQKNSLLAFSKDWNIFTEFCQRKSVNPLPASVTAVRLFLESEAKVRKFSTIRRYSVTIGMIHYLLNQKDPTLNVQVRQLLQRLRVEKYGDEKQAECFTRQHLASLYQLMVESNESLAIRDLAIYHVMFECAMKRGELKKLSFTDITEDHSQLRISSEIYQLSPSAQQILARWTALISQQDGAVFRSIDRHGNINNRPLDDSSIYRILRRAGDLLALPHLKFSGQSTRIGAVKELAEQGYHTKDIQSFGRWLSPAMPNQYLGKLHTAAVAKIKFTRIKPWT